MSNLRHPHITQFLGVCYLPGSQLPVLLMEKLLTCFHSLLEDNPGIPLDIKHQILTGVMAGLVYLHSRNPSIIHRDFTARNILLDMSLNAKIADMGVARMVTLHPGQVAATMTQGPGNVNYMPPEAVGDGTTKYNTAIDIFSFGHMSLFAFTQIFPKDLKPSSYFDPATQRILGRSEVERRINYCQVLYQELGQSHPLVDLVHQCLAYRPQDRPSASEVLGKLENAQTRVPQAWNMTKLELIKQIVKERSQHAWKQERIGFLEKHVFDQQKLIDEERNWHVHLEKQVFEQKKQIDYLAENLQRKLVQVRSLEQNLREHKVNQGKEEPRFTFREVSTQMSKHGLY